MNFSIIIPAHNEENNIEKTIRTIKKDVLGNYEILVVDDHSIDGTAKIVIGLTKEYNNLILISNTKQASFANTLRAGFEKVNSDIVIPVMADLCDDPQDINKMYEEIQKGFDIICGSRYMPGGKKEEGPKLKSFFSKIYSLSLYFLINIPTHDIANAFKMYKKKVVDSVAPDAKGFEISVELPLKAFFAGYKISEIPTVWTDRKEGESKFRVSKQSLGYLWLYLWALKRSISLCL